MYLNIMWSYHIFQRKTHSADIYSIYTAACKGSAHQKKVFFISSHFY